MCVLVRSCSGVKWIGCRRWLHIYQPSTLLCRENSDLAWEFLSGMRIPTWQRWILLIWFDLWSTWRRRGGDIPFILGNPQAFVRNSQVSEVEEMSENLRKVSGWPGGAIYCNICIKIYNYIIIIIKYIIILYIVYFHIYCRCMREKRDSNLQPSYRSYRSRAVYNSWRGKYTAIHDTSASYNIVYILYDRSIDSIVGIDRSYIDQSKIDWSNLIIYDVSKRGKMTWH